MHSHAIFRFWVIKMTEHYVNIGNVITKSKSNRGNSYYVTTQTPTNMF